MYLTEKSVEILAMSHEGPSSFVLRSLISCAVATSPKPPQHPYGRQVLAVCFDPGECGLTHFATVPSLIVCELKGFNKVMQM